MIIVMNGKMPFIARSSPGHRVDGPTIQAVVGDVPEIEDREPAAARPTSTRIRRAEEHLARVEPGAGPQLGPAGGVSKRHAVRDLGWAAAPRRASCRLPGSAVALAQVEQPVGGGQMARETPSTSGGWPEDSRPAAASACCARPPSSSAPPGRRRRRQGLPQRGHLLQARLAQHPAHELADHEGDDADIGPHHRPRHGGHGEEDRRGQQQRRQGQNEIGEQVVARTNGPTLSGSTHGITAPSAMPAGTARNDRAAAAKAPANRPYR
jgi:hypothetical protein